MGAGFHGGINNSSGAQSMSFVKKNSIKIKSQSNNSISSNANEAAKLFKFKDGLFGIKNRKPKSKPREIIVSNPKTSASIFFNTLAAGGKKETFDTGHGKGIKATLLDKSIITYRPITSSNGSPAVEIVVSGSKNVKAKKYHIVKKGDR